MSLPYDLSGHTDCSSPLGVVVHQENGESIRLPVIDDGLQLYERKVGPTSITRRAEVTVPIEDRSGNDWLSYVAAFRADDSEEPSDIQIADVIGQPVASDPNGQLQPVGKPTVLFRGYVAAIGSREGVNRARFRIYDPMKFLDSIEAGMKFNAPTPTDVLKTIRDEYVNGQTVFNDVSVDTDGLRSRLLRGLLAERGVFTIDFEDSEGFSRSELPSSFRDKVFSTNRDTLKDVIQWLMRTANIRVWFQPKGKQGLTLTGVVDDSQQYDLTPSSENPPRVIKNNALYELSPANGLRLKGGTGHRIGVAGKGVNLPTGNTYPEAVATYPPLVDRFGGEVIDSATAQITNPDKLEDAAKKQLKDQLDKISGGEMVTTLAPMVRPYDRVEATPACAGVTTDVDALTYEVQEAVHSVVPGDNNVPRTTLSVSMAVDPSKIEVRSTVKDAWTGGEPSDNDPMDEYEMGYGTAP